jgi:hypothetical protein
MMKIAKIVVAVMFAAIGLSAQAQIIIPSTAVTFTGQSGGSSVPNSTLSITYEVTLSGGLYTYSYILSSPSTDPMLSFTLGGVTDPVDTQTVAFANIGHTDPALNGITANSIVFGWDFSKAVTSDTVSYTSVNGPTLATFTLNDDDVVWGSPSPIPAPTPAVVPEAPTVLAGAVMLLPFGVGAFRSMKKRLSPK